MIRSRNKIGWCDCHQARIAKGKKVLPGQIVLYIEVETNDEGICLYCGHYTQKHRPKRGRPKKNNEADLTKERYNEGITTNRQTEGYRSPRTRG